MKNHLLSGIAVLALLGVSTVTHAADILRRSPPVATPIILAPYNWTGFYVGGNIGGGWSNLSVTDTFTGVTWATNGAAFIGGVQAGYNWQIENIVLGVEWDFDWIGSGSHTGTVATGLGSLQLSANPNWATTIAARFGIAANNWLFYGKVGGGWIGSNATVLNLTTGAGWNGSNTSGGWLLGGGIEYAFTRNWTAKLEYNYLGLSDWSSPTTLAPSDTAVVSGNVQMVKVGVNYKF